MKRIVGVLGGDGGGWLAEHPSRKRGGNNAYHQTQCKNGEQALALGCSIPLSGCMWECVHVRLCTSLCVA